MTYFGPGLQASEPLSLLPHPVSSHIIIPAHIAGVLCLKYRFTHEFSVQKYSKGYCLFWNWIMMIVA